MHPPSAANLEEPQSSAAPDAVPIEIEIAALIKAAGESLRDQSRSDHTDTKQADCRSPAAIPNEADECPASPPKIFDNTVKNAGLEPRTWDLRISDAERIFDPSDRAKRTRTSLLAGALIGTLGIGAILGLTFQIFDNGASGPAEQEDHSRPEIYGTPETRPRATPAAHNTKTIATPKKNLPAYRPDTVQSTARRSPGAQQNVGSEPAASRVWRVPNTSIMLESFPETRPTTIEGWTVREVVDGTALLEGPEGVWRVTRGDTVPGVGAVNSIVRWGSRWIVATSGGLISTP
jgi:hypothetical protein